MKEKKLQLKTIMGKFLAMLLVVVTIFSVGMPLSAKAATTTVTNGTDLKVHYFNVGLGTCVILEQNGHYMLIDTGEESYTLNTGTEYALSGIKKWMNTKKVTKFDYVIISHYDADHVRNLKSILKLDTKNPIKVGKFLARKYSKAAMKKMLQRSEKTTYAYLNDYINFVNVVLLSPGTIKNPTTQITSKGSTITDKFDAVYDKIENISKKTNEDGELLWKNPTGDYSCVFGNGVKIKFYTLNNGDTYATNANIIYKEAVNDDSLVFKITYNAASFWFFNDLKKDGMIDILNRTRKADYDTSVVLLPHHGIMHDQITKAIKAQFTQKLKGAAIFVRSVDKAHRDLNDDQKAFMNLFKERNSDLYGKTLLQTCQNKGESGTKSSITITTKGKVVNSKLYNVKINWRN